MAQITITVPDGVLPRVRTAFANTYGWHAGLGITQAEFARQQIGKYVKEVVKGYETSQAAESARQTATDAAEADITIT